MLTDPLHAVPQLLEVNEVAVILRYSPDHVRRLIRARKLPAVRLGKRWRVERAAVIAFIEAQRWQAADEAPEILRGRDGPRPLPQNRGA